jgi:lipoprotein-anchoring transpeptidase ErfK/SrfK
VLRGRFNLIVVVLAGWTLALAAEEPAVSVPFVPRPVEGTLELQVELHRRGFSCGSIDGVAGGQTAAALRAFQRSRGLPESGAPDRATLEQLPLSAPALLEFVPDEEERTVRPLPETWLGKSREPALVQSSVLEAVAERFRAHPRLLQRLNPGVEWEALPEGAAVTVPAVEYVALPRHAAAIHIKLAARELELVDDVGRVLAHFPVSIARKVEKRPQGELRVRTAAREPNYTFDPEHFPDAPEAKDPGRKLVLPPGPNNPVGRVWIGLDRPGYGIHGTPEPEKVGRTESLGCFRLANWDALALIDVVRVGMVVWVDE